MLDNLIIGLMGVVSEAYSRLGWNCSDDCNLTIAVDLSICLAIGLLDVFRLHMSKAIIYVCACVVSTAYKSRETHVKKSFTS